MTRDPDVLICPLRSERERAAADEMKSMLGLGSDADLVRAALWYYGRWLDPRIDALIFRVERGTRNAVRDR